MDPLDTRSDLRHLVVPSPPAEVWAAMGEAARIARWWGPAGFTCTVHTWDFVPGGRWVSTLHGPDGTDYPNESRFTRLVEERLFEIEHVVGHHFVLTIELAPHGAGTALTWRQAFDTAAHYGAIAAIVGPANAQNLEKLAAEVQRGARAAWDAPPPPAG